MPRYELTSFSFESRYRWSERTSLTSRSWQHARSWRRHVPNVVSTISHSCLDIILPCKLVIFFSVLCHVMKWWEDLTFSVISEQLISFQFVWWHPEVSKKTQRLVIIIRFLKVFALPEVSDLSFPKECK